jgi:hypothetical protein
MSLNLGNSVTTVENALTTDVLPMASSFETKVFKFLTHRVNIFGAKLSVSKALVKYGAVVVLAIGLFGTQVYLYEQHQNATGRIGTVESLAEQTDTNFVIVNSKLDEARSLISANQTAQTTTDAKVTALAAKVAADEAKLSPARPTTAVTKKYFRKK